MDEIILDTCVLLDIFLSSRPRHQTAGKLMEYIREKNITIVIPTTSLFELNSSIAQEKAGSKKLELNESVNQNSPLRTRRIDIDESFIEKYFDPNLPYLKAGDKIFFAIASKDKLPLITEDKQMLNAGKNVGLEIFDMDTFLKAKNYS